MSDSPHDAEVRNGPSLLTIIIVSYNSRAYTLACLESLSHQRIAGGVQIIVVDNASVDGTAGAVAACYPQVQLCALTTNIGFARANNYGITHATSRFILLLNPDTLVHADALAQMIAFMDTSDNIGIAGCRTLNGDGTLQRNCFHPPGFVNILFSSVGLHRLFARSMLFGRERMTYWDLTDARRVPVVAGCFMLIRRSLVERIGLFDERFFMYAEEVDLCMRTVNAGWEVWYSPCGTITHYGGVSAATARAAMDREMQVSLLLLLRKYHSPGYVGMCRLVLTAGVVARATLKAAREAIRMRPMESIAHMVSGARRATVFIRGVR